ncbi:hypothetical protein C2S52_013686 [Perilla frutescens var. hirtella]|nr:hypothetical protein C2S52_013686 [Perilla frutescens var. hirtella]
MDNDAADINEVVYSDTHVEILRNDMKTLANSQYVSSAVLDVWCAIMNHNEQLRDPNSTRRFFATTLVQLWTRLHRGIHHKD